MQIAFTQVKSYKKLKALSLTETSTTYVTNEKL